MSVARTPSSCVHIVPTRPERKTASSLTLALNILLQLRLSSIYDSLHIYWSLSVVLLTMYILKTMLLFML